ncbi:MULTISPECIES: DUF1697 domain-containing protein [unclassified Mesorhizobium]|uniref:DUF1697 domain-containing protein n=1 Tax=unclassified Mesorhizobium TaxID=325217 RepID=UPI000BB0A2BD|nr:MULTISPECIES: DUF1697 domain-containing protein [unclassified Mesorhizobium]TGT59641.1 DUF1697 domain-containing protein [Mesorhizobium sp. M00.F.Ca.ET.170.01.1.1]AZO12646.1 DUF1697 domain-containing protein [Mesorhizobium sp. M3A.F.Ca.ET.080.04.2.1]PBB87222.1 hypothetical protein CK216_09725 [Mesorhizobium sp. WSM3876]RWB91117.1 MAG: DUF1697 domain-containing protein [Mesorhizobium sp.]RWE25262.1 MAG: DUF1697 domain-containing protein [Mesorhizobium sp.]
MSGPEAKTFVALFSGINVGGNRIVKMAELRTFFEELGFRGVATYVQSGNAVFCANGDAAALRKQLEAAFEKKWGFHSRIMVRDCAWFEQMVKDNPYPEVAGEPTKLHACVLEREPTAEETKRLAEKCTGPERFEIKGDVLYLHAPDGLGKSVFANLIGRTLKVPVTARNWRSVLALLEMAGKAGHA